MFTADGEAIFSPYQVAILRIFFAAIVFIPTQVKHFKKAFVGKHVLPLLAVGVVGTGIPAFMFTMAEQTINSAMAGMLNAAVPMMSIFVGLLFFNAEITKRQWVGTILGLIAVFGLSYGSFQRSNEIVPIVLIIIATLCYAMSLNSIKYRLSHLPSIQITGLAFMFLIPFAIAGIFVFDIPETIQNTEDVGTPLLFVFILGFLGTAIAVVLYARLVALSGPVFASSVTYLIPVVATFWGVADGETISFLEVGMMGLIIMSVLIINKRLKKFWRLKKI